MSTKKNLLNTVTIKLGCISLCRRPKLSSIFSPKPKLPKYHQTHFNHHYYYRHPSSATTTTTTPTTTFSDTTTDNNNYYNYNYQTTPTTTTNTTSSSPFMAAAAAGEEYGRAVAVEKESSDPYLDFRASMLQMIVENEMYTKDDLRHLLTCFLQLNSPCLHGVIIRAFTEIWNSFFFSASNATASTSTHPRGRSHGGRRAARKDSYGRPPKAYVRAKSYEI